MRIRNDLAQSAVSDFITETFNSFEFSPKNALNMIGAKMYVHNHFDLITQVLAKDGYIDIEALEKYAIEIVEKLGKFEVPAVGTRYMFDANDVKRLIAKMKEHAE